MADLFFQNLFSYFFPLAMFLQIIFTHVRNNISSIKSNLNTVPLLFGYFFFNY